MPPGSLDRMSVQGIVRFRRRMRKFGDLDEILLRIPMIVTLSFGAAPPTESSHGYSRGILQ